ncbi:MAG: hypothetical protein COU08_02925 [Candidatus Harrisonbacteria bacterium CG10_big_fil_rev_8_21_14_0_10_42_17]|uniref:Vitamin K epoxide reductase domain-containing protein n=1 Tax=Candidatus Harrisonbacteria bacterium CG10_big_fil_rev_8_21_14_0_10_42_17 TaxID=1974584 RepID=A0A2M6WHS0_9BACT|nr:MAG: hypothetical protein COU08_02925 [Candidatus Harrisonbacteria bacterium CG10_big_fil_rev_8_21_14_0_10_42_17]
MGKQHTTKTNLHTSIRIFISILAVIGLGIMVYLTYLHFSHTESFCNLSETVSCDTVTTSIYSEFFGIPLSILGIGYFIFALLFLAFHRRKTTFQALFLITLFAFIPSLYLSFLELFVIKALCILCESSKIVMLLILVTTYTVSRKQERVEVRMMIPVVIAGVVAALVTYFAQTTGGFQQDTTALIACMNEQNVTYYKSFRCTNCKRQERLLGEPYKDLNQVECHPDGEGGNPQLCLQKSITHTPTFIIEEHGVEVRRVVGLQNLEELSEFSGCPL